MKFAKTLFLLLAGHALCDYPLQSEFLSKGKNHRTSPYLAWMPAYWCLFAHAMIHGGTVLLITDSLPLGIAEAVLHAGTDYAKCDGRINMDEDQAMHIACKVAWAVLASQNQRAVEAVEREDG